MTGTTHPSGSGPLAMLVDHALYDGVASAIGRIGMDPLLAATGDAAEALAPMASLVLAAVFALAAVTKLADRPTTVADFASLGLPWPGPLARVVPPAELVIAVALVARPIAGAAAATAALVAFTAVLAAAVRAGRTVSCGCLGPLSRRPVSHLTLVRNLGLVGLAALAAITPAPRGPVPTLPAGDVVLAVGPAVLLAAVVVQLLSTRHQLGRLWSVELAGETSTGPAGRRTSRSGATAAAADHPASIGGDHGGEL